MVWFVLENSAPLRLCERLHVGGGLCCSVFFSQRRRGAELFCCELSDHHFIGKMASGSIDLRIWPQKRGALLRVRLENKLKFAMAISDDGARSAVGRMLP